MTTSTDSSTPSPSTPSRRRRLGVDIGDPLFKIVSGAMAYLVLAALLGAAASMYFGGQLAFRTFGWKFLYGTDWDAVNKQFGAAIPIYGTIVTSVIAMAIAIPSSFTIAFFLTEVAPRWMRGPVSIAIELLAAIPSIIYGMWGLFVFAPFMATKIEPWMNDHLGPLPVIGTLLSGPPIGIGMLTAGIILGIMVIPFITAVTRDVFLAVPPTLRESAFALGATPWEVVTKVSFPYARTAVIGAIFLGLGRALGETMAVTFVLGNAHDFSKSLLMPGNSIAAAIANEFTEADSPIYLSSLIALGFLLFIVTFIVLACARLLLHQLSRQEGAIA